jgi:hypothetical protein
MSIRVDAYMSNGVAGGVLAGSATLRDVLEEGTLSLDAATWQTLGSPIRETPGTVSLVSDEILVAVGDDDPGLSIHANWHRVHLESGPYVIEGDLATMPGFDPGRALTRPSGGFLELRDVRVTRAGLPGTDGVAADHALVNRYAVERIQADLMLGFFFPGAEVDAVDLEPERI